MKLSIRQIADLIHAEVVGDSSLEISSLSKIQEGVPGSISFLANPKYQEFIYTTKASAVIVSKEFEPQASCTTTLLKVDDPYQAFSLLLEKASHMRISAKKGVDPNAVVSKNAEVGEDVYIGPFVYIGERVKIANGVKIFPHTFIGDDCIIGAGSILHANVSIYDGSRIGKSCIIHSGARIGCDGFGFIPLKDGSYQKVPQTGWVEIQDEVEIGANTTIDRATLGKTVVEKGVKLDNLVHLAHNVEVGSHTVIAAQAGIAGSTSIGKYSMIGGQAGIVGHLKIANRTRIDAQSGVNCSIPEEGGAFRGSPIQPHRSQLKSEVLFRKLEEMYKRIQQLEAQLVDKENS